MPLLSNANVLQLRDGEPLTLLVSEWQIGELDIRPRTGPGVLRVRALRLHLGPPWQQLGFTYVDATGGRLIEAIAPWLPNAGEPPRLLSITAFGKEPARSFTVRLQRWLSG